MKPFGVCATAPRVNVQNDSAVLLTDLVQLTDGTSECGSRIRSGKIHRMTEGKQVDVRR